MGGRGSFGKSPDFLRNLFVKPSLINFPSTKISFFGPYCAISETLQNFNIFLEFFHFGTAELICQNKVLGVVGGVLGCTVISVIMPPPQFYRKYAPPFFDGSFLIFLR